VTRLTGRPITTRRNERFTCAGHAGRMRIATAVLTFRLLPALALASVALLDLIAHSRSWGLLVIGALDEPAHVATALLVLLAVAGPRRLLAHPRLSGAAIVGSVAIDLDHLPLYAGLPVDVAGGRPFTHCLLTAVVLAAAALAIARFRSILTGLATGVLLHLVRDLPTGPGVSLFWPVSPTRFEMPYAVYAVILVGCAGIATLRVSAERRQTRSGAEDPRRATLGP
jgi:inner membrane protein